MGKRTLRIIGGEWRGRRIVFPPLPGLRPTPDRVRETLFNWLQGVVPGARCLDLFAGSGLLGIEAASRGAAKVVMAERSREAVAHLREQVRRLEASERIEVVRADALRWLEGPPQPFGVVFLDPPFGEGLVPPCCERLEERGWLEPGARIYLELEAEAGVPWLPANWTLMRSKRAGQVGYHLAVRS